MTRAIESTKKRIQRSTNGGENHIRDSTLGSHIMLVKKSKGEAKHQNRGLTRGKTRLAEGQKKDG